MQWSLSPAYTQSFNEFSILLQTIQIISLVEYNAACQYKDMSVQNTVLGLLLPFSVYA